MASELRAYVKEELKKGKTEEEVTRDLVRKLDKVAVLAPPPGTNLSKDLGNNHPRFNFVACNAHCSAS
jgi:hypothetical protein